MKAGCNGVFSMLEQTKKMQMGNVNSIVFINEALDVCYIHNDRAFSLHFVY